LVDNKVLPGDAFLEVDGPIRKAFELIVKVWDKKDRFGLPIFYRDNFPHFFTIEPLLSL
jgi:hypothetical protein